MKKQFALVLGALVAAVVMVGCAGVTTNNGGVALPAMGPVFYAKVKANAVLPAQQASGTIVKKDVTATATLKGFFSCVTMGDASYATLKAAALKQAPGATDLINVKIDYAQDTIIGINTVTVTLTADAIK